MSFPPFCSWFWLSCLCQTTHPWCLLPTPGCQGLVLCQCQGGEHEAPAHSEPPLHSCLLRGAEGQQIITPCCSSLMCVFISYNYVAVLGYSFILKLQQRQQARRHAQDGCPGCCRKVWAFNNPFHDEDLINKSLLSPLQPRVSGNGSSCLSASHYRDLQGRVLEVTPELSPARLHPPKYYQRITEQFGWKEP